MILVFVIISIVKIAAILPSKRIRRIPEKILASSDSSESKDEDEEEKSKEMESAESKNLKPQNLEDKSEK